MQQATTYNSLLPEQDDTNLYVSKLPGEFSQIQLNELFGRFGPIVSSRILTDNLTGRSKCSGFIKFAEKDHAERALMELNGSCLFNPADPLQIRYANKSASSGSHGSRSNSSKDSGGPIRNRSNPVNRFNPIATGVNPAYNQNGQSQGYPATYNNLSAFSSASTMSIPSNQMRMPHGSVVANRSGHVPLSTTEPVSHVPQPTDEMVANCFHHTQGWSLYVCNLTEQFDELMMYKLFSPFGAVSSVKAMVDADTGKNKGYGFVNMPQYDSAFEAVRLMHGVELAPGKVLSVSFKANRKNTANKRDRSRVS